MDLGNILRESLVRGASDIHLAAGQPPAMRVRTGIERVDGGALSDDEVRAVLRSIAPPMALETFERVCDADFSCEIDLGEGVRMRARVNAHLQRGGAALSLRLIRGRAPLLESLGLPPVVEQLTRLPRGLVLVTGHTGSGKSTTLAAMVAAINAREAKRVVTLEDPIEYVVESERCVVEQRELGRDMPSFASGLRHALRQDPDVILVGEMRDPETASLALTAAETGHLVLSTLHTVNASQTVDRIVDMHPTGAQNHVRTMLAGTLQSVICQTLFRAAPGGAPANTGPRGRLAAATPTIARIGRDAQAPDGGLGGMVAAVESFVCTPAARNLIREGRTFEIPNIIDTNRALGMQSMDTAIADLHRRGLISREDAIARATAPDRLERTLAA